MLMWCVKKKKKKTKNGENDKWQPQDELENVFGDGVKCIHSVFFFNFCIGFR